jgi:hypothetical protein
VIYILLSESALLKAGCLLATQEHEKAREVLNIAYAQYESEKRLRFRSPVANISNSPLTNKKLTALIEENEEEIKKTKSGKSFDSDDTSSKIIESHMSFDMVEYSSWDNSKKIEYTYRNQILPALICYNLSNIYGFMGNFEKQESYLNESVDIMSLIIKKFEKGYRFS